MPIKYRVYRGDSSGGPVDFSTPVGDVAGLTFDSDPLPGSSDTTFAVMAYDDVSGLEDRSADSRVRVRLDESGRDASLYPKPPFALHGQALSGGTARFTWAYPGRGGAAGFHLYLWPASGPQNYTNPVLSVSARPGPAAGNPSPAYQATVTGLTGGVAYVGACRAYNAGGEEQNRSTVNLTGVTSGPSPVVALAATISA